MTITEAKVEKAKTVLSEFYAQTATCARNDSHTLTNREAFEQGWTDSEVHGWLCKPCAAELRAEKAGEVECPDWCTDCVGYDIEDGGFSHRRCWYLSSRGRVLNVYQLVDSRGAVYEQGATLDELDELTRPELQALVTVVSEADELMMEQGLVTITQGVAS